MSKPLLCLGLVLALAAPLLAAETATPPASNAQPAAKAATQPANLPAMTWEKRDMKAITRVFNEPIKLTLSKDSAMHVTFRHSDHKGPSCEVCHHKATPAGERLVSCSTAPECHVIPGKSDGPLSRFQAFHSKMSTHSCYACHLKENPRFDGARGCTTCHKQLARGKP